MNRIIKLLGIMLNFVNCSYLRTTNSYLRVPQPMMHELPIHDINNFLIAKSNFCADHSPFILNVLKNDINKEIVKNLSGMLPQADIISKKVLEWNDIWIERILDSRTIPENVKKTIILEMISIVQNGDNAGSGFLIWYKDVIDCLLP